MYRLSRRYLKGLNAYWFYIDVFPIMFLRSIDVSVGFGQCTDDLNSSRKKVTRIEIWALGSGFHLWVFSGKDPVNTLYM